MAHEVEQMFSVEQTPWHGLGRIINEAPSIEEAIRLAGLDWNVVKREIYVRDPDGSMVCDKERKAIVRETDGAIFAVLKNNYTPLQNKDAFKFFDPFVQNGLASLETAGSLRGGKNVWALAKLNRKPMEIGPNDSVNKFLLLSNGHDGKMAVRVGFTPIRVVCANTLAESHGHAQSKLLRVMHSKQVQVRMEQIQEIVNAADARFEATAEQYRRLTQVDVDQKRLQEYVDIVFRHANPKTDAEKKARETMTGKIVQLFETGRGAELKTARGTMWGLYNATAEYLAYDRGKSNDGRLHSLWFADSAKVNAKALDTALEMAA